MKIELNKKLMILMLNMTYAVHAIFSRFIYLDSAGYCPCDWSIRLVHRTRLPQNVSIISDIFQIF